MSLFKKYRFFFFLIKIKSSLMRRSASSHSSLRSNIVCLSRYVSSEPPLITSHNSYRVNRFSCYGCIIFIYLLFVKRIFQKIYWISSHLLDQLRCGSRWWRHGGRCSCGRRRIARRCRFCSRRERRASGRLSERGSASLHLLLRRARTHGLSGEWCQAPLSPGSAHTETSALESK